MEGAAAPDAGNRNPLRVADPFPRAEATTGMDIGFAGVLAAAVSAMILRKSALPVSTVFDFHIGVLTGVDEPDVEPGWKGAAPRLNGVIDLEPLFGVRTPDALVVGVGTSSSIWKIPSAADDLSETSALGLTIGEGGALRLAATVLAEERSTGDSADLAALYLNGCRTIGAGMSWTNSHSRCFAINSFTSTPSLATGDRFFCFSAITFDRSCRTLWSISSNKPLSSIVSRHEMI